MCIPKIDHCEYNPEKDYILFIQNTILSSGYRLNHTKYLTLWICKRYWKSMNRHIVEVQNGKERDPMKPIWGMTVVLEDSDLCNNKGVWVIPKTELFNLEEETT